MRCNAAAWRIPCAAVVLATAPACGARTGLDEAGPDAAVDAPPPGCGASSCSGCCDDAGACEPGTATLACGVAGRRCQACNPSFDVCNPQGNPDVTGVVCYQPCDLRSCAGCCTPAGACVGGTSDTSCGGPFRVCADCTALGQTCSTGEAIRSCM